MIVPSFVSCSTTALAVLLEERIVCGVLIVKLAAKVEVCLPLALVLTIILLCALATITMLIVPNALLIPIAVGVATMIPLEDVGLVMQVDQPMVVLALLLGYILNVLEVLVLLVVFVEVVFVVNVNAPLDILDLIAILPLVVMGFQDQELSTMCVECAREMELLALVVMGLLMDLCMILVVYVEEMVLLALIYVLTVDVPLVLLMNIASGVVVLTSASRRQKLVLQVPSLLRKINVVPI